MAKARKGQLEKHIQSAIEDLLQLHEALGHLVYQKNNTGAIRINREYGKSSFMRFGKLGSPDFLVWRKRHDALETMFIEVKSDVGTQSPDQKKFQQKIEKLGGSYYIVRSFDEAKALILNN